MLADSLRYVESIPDFGIPHVDPLFWRIVGEGTAIIPHLIAKMSDTRKMKHIPVRYFGGVYTVADVAYIALQEIIAGIPTFELLGVPCSEEYGNYVYWWHVRASRRNRKNFQQAIGLWYEANKCDLVWEESNLSVTCDTNFTPVGGRYELRNPGEQ